MKRRILALALLLGGCMTFEVQESHFFNPGPAEHAPNADVEPLTLTASDGTKLAGVRFGDPNGDADVVYFGGNVSRIDDFPPELAPPRANVYMFDYRGYGRSGGTPTIEALKSDAVAIADFVRRRNGNRPLVVHGFSLGSFLAAHVAETVPVDGLVLESTAPDVEQWAKNQVPGYAKPFVRIRIAPALLRESTERAVRTYDGPLLIVTGSKDAITPPRFAESLGAIARSPQKRVVIAPGATHGDAMLAPLARQEYATFLAAVRRRAGL
jgi:pimeloyl-ACP methyl ester carboxylesterase